MDDPGDWITPQSATLAAPADGDWITPNSTPSEQPASTQWHNMLPNKPGETYGGLLPIETGPGVEGKPWYQHLAAPQPVRDIVQGIGDMYEGAENQSLNTTPNAVTASMALAPLAALRFGYPAPSYTPEQYQQAINQGYEKATGSRKPFYDFMNQSAQGQTVDTKPLVTPAKKIIEEISSDPYHPSRAALPRMQAFVDQFENDDKMPLADAVEMKQDINSYFKPNKFTQGAKSPYFQLGNSLDTQISKAAEQNPIFAQAKTLADQNHVNNVALPFQQNDLLKKFWQPEDYYAAKSMEKGLAQYLPDETQQRARTMIGNIKTPEQLNAITRILPPDMAAVFRQDVMKSATAGNTAYRFGELGNYAGEPLKPKHIFNAIRGQTYSPEESLLIKATKQPSPQLTDYMPQLQELKSIPNPPYSMVPTPGALPAPPPRLALPAPQSDMIPSNQPYTSPSGVAERPYSGQVMPQTPAQRDAAIAMRQNPDAIAAQTARAEQPPPSVLNTELRQKQAVTDSITAWRKAASNLSSKGFSHKEIVNKIGEKPKMPD